MSSERVRNGVIHELPFFKFIERLEIGGEVKWHQHNLVFFQTH